MKYMSLWICNVLKHWDVGDAIPYKFSHSEIYFNIQKILQQRIQRKYLAKNVLWPYSQKSGRLQKNMGIHRHQYYILDKKWIISIKRMRKRRQRSDRSFSNAPIQKTCCLPNGKTAGLFMLPRFADTPRQTTRECGRFAPWGANIQTTPPCPLRRGIR